MPAITTNSKAVVSLRNLDTVLAGLDDFSKRQAPYAIKTALNNVAQSAKDDVVDEMRRVFDRPTPYTLNAFRIDYATKSKLSARIWFKDPERLSTPNHYLAPNVYGGSRDKKPYEKALYRIGILRAGQFTVLASGAEQDAYGNISAGQIVQILAFFQAFATKGYKANMTAASKTKLKKTTAKKVGMEYFAITGYKQAGPLRPGIYQRWYLPKGAKIVPVLLFVDRVSYERRRLDVQTIAAWTFKKEFNSAFDDSMKMALRTAFRK